MTLEEAQTIALIAGTADGGCSTCVSNMLKRLNAAFPEFTFSISNGIKATYEKPDWSNDPDDINCVGIKVEVILNHQESSPPSKTKQNPFYSEEEVNVLRKASENGWSIPDDPISKQDMMNSANEYLKGQES